MHLRDIILETSPISVYSGKLYNHNLSRDKLFLPFFKNILIKFLCYVMRVGCIFGCIQVLLFVKAF